MTIWCKGESAPKDRAIVVYGTPEGEYGSSRQNTAFWPLGIYLAQYDDCDDAFCLKGGGWLGPFIKPIAWAEEPESPKDA